MIPSIPAAIGSMRSREKSKVRIGNGRCWRRMRMIVIKMLGIWKLEGWACLIMLRISSGKKAKLSQRTKSNSLKIYWKSSHNPHKKPAQSTTNNTSISSKKSFNIIRSNLNKNNILMNYSKRDHKNKWLLLTQKASYQQKFIFSVGNIIIVWVRSEPYPRNKWNWW